MQENNQKLSNPRLKAWGWFILSYHFHGEMQQIIRITH